MTQLKWPGFNEAGSAIIPLTWDDPGLPEKRICFRGEWFEPKDELHVTVIGKQAGALLRERVEQDPATGVLIRQGFEAIDWQYVPAGPVHVLSRPAKESESREQGMAREKTIIFRINMPGMAQFYDALKSRDLITTDTPVPPPHITLYTRNCPGGMGLPDEARLLELTENVLSVSELDKICRSS